MSSRKVVLCGAGFLGSNIALAVSRANNAAGFLRRIQVTSRNPHKVYCKLTETIPRDHLLSPVPVDVTRRESLKEAFENADTVVSLVGILQGSMEQFEAIQWKGAENVAQAAAAVGAKLVHISAIGADSSSKIPYTRTKGLGEEAVLSHCPNAVVIRPSLVFGPGDGFFNRFAQLSRYLPVLPVFGKGDTLFQPIYVGDIGRLVEILTRDSLNAACNQVDGKIIEAGGPDIMTYRQIMELVIKYTGRYRPIISVPWTVGEIQGEILQRLPTNMFTVTRDQIEQLKIDSVITSTHSNSRSHVDLKEFMEAHSYKMASVHDVLPHYLK
ncbi:NAD-P-binding protein [Multifurca ochricompacta]|uniref:NAD-P-binding protein n=1 Tax=Multifurca ochricompacta TaxID=376703 RepID=A0AAD4MHP1_9AGAM|nr:NAD-P-binding protein [Multifurca ochricompacta]